MTLRPIRKKIGREDMAQNKIFDMPFAFGMPSCVPSCSKDIETSGFILGPEEVDRFMKRDDIHFLAEMMNFPGVLGDDPEVMAKIASTKAAGKPVDGHAPGLVGSERMRYADAGISTDHECTTIEIGRSAIESGMIVQIREGSAAKDYAALAPLIAEAPGMTMFCTDDCHNIVAVGTSDEELVKVINRVIEMKGGIAVSDGTVTEDLPLPIAGIISPLCGHELAFRCTLLNEVVRNAGCSFHSPFITLAFMCLPVIPQLKLTDKGLFDSEKFEIIS